MSYSLILKRSLYASCCLIYNSSRFTPLGHRDTAVRRNYSEISTSSLAHQFSKNTTTFYKNAKFRLFFNHFVRVTACTTRIRRGRAADADSPARLAGWLRDTDQPAHRQDPNIHLQRPQTSSRVLCEVTPGHAQGLRQDACQSNHCMQRLGGEIPRSGRKLLEHTPSKSRDF